MKHLISLLSLSIFLILAGCNGKASKRTKEIKPTTRTEQPQPTNITSNILQLADVSLTIPEGWKQVAPSSKMRVAQLQLADNAEVEMAVFFFGQQDMADANIERWKGQYSKLDAHKDLETSVENMVAIKLEGTFKLKAFPMAQDFTEAPGYATLAAIVPTSEGPYYLKMSAPNNIILAEETSFMEMLNSFTTK